VIAEFIVVEGLSYEIAESQSLRRLLSVANRLNSVRDLRVSAETAKKDAKMRATFASFTEPRIFIIHRASGSLETGRGSSVTKV